METIILGNGVQKIPKAYKATSQKNYIYLIQVLGDPKFPNKIVYKIGTTCNIIQRMKQHLAKYKCKKIILLWISPLYSIHTALRVEHKFVREVKQSDWKHIPQDRFFVPEGVEEIIIRVRKDWVVKIGEG